jgi:hypothetical protein
MDNQKLKELFHFDDSDLLSNRNGQFSAKQNDRLFGRHNSAVRQKHIASAILIPLSILMLVWMVYLIYKDIVGANGSDIGAIILLGLFGVLFLLAGCYIFRISFIGPRYLLKKTEGSINIVRQSQLTNNGTSVRYELHVAKEIFNLHLDSTLSDIMMPGDNYAIYYSQGVENELREILSVELISKAK